MDNIIFRKTQLLAHETPASSPNDKKDPPWNSVAKLVQKREFAAIFVIPLLLRALTKTQKK